MLPAGIFTKCQLITGFFHVIDRKCFAGYKYRILVTLKDFRLLVYYSLKNLIVYIFCSHVDDFSQKIHCFEEYLSDCYSGRIIKKCPFRRKKDRIVHFIGEYFMTESMNFSFPENHLNHFSNRSLWFIRFV